MRKKVKIEVGGCPKYLFHDVTIYYGNGTKIYKVGKNGEWIEINPKKKWWQFWR